VNVGPTEIIVVLIIALLVFGPKRLPQMGRSLGKGVREFRNAAETAKSELGLGEVTDQINEVKGTFGDLKSSVDLKSAIEAPVAGKDAAASGAAAAAGLAGADASEPKTPTTAPGPEAPAVAPETEAAAVTPEAPEAPEPPEPPEDSVAAGAGAAGGPTTGA
jgi:TatA/E family protein of Tat protein translocase